MWFIPRPWTKVWTKINSRNHKCIAINRIRSRIKTGTNIESEREREKKKEIQFGSVVATVTWVIRELSNQLGLLVYTSHSASRRRDLSDAAMRNNTPVKTIPCSCENTWWRSAAVRASVLGCVDSKDRSVSALFISYIVAVSCTHSYRRSMVLFVANQTVAKLVNFSFFIIIMGEKGWLIFISFVEGDKVNLDMLVI